MSELFETAVTGDQFLTAMQDTLIMVGLSLGFGSLLGLRLALSWWSAVQAVFSRSVWCISC